jgi:hypothetical protein
VAIEARRCISRDHEREDPAAFGSLAHGGRGHSRDAENGEQSAAVTFHGVLLPKRGYAACAGACAQPYFRSYADAGD